MKIWPYILIIAALSGTATAHDQLPSDNEERIRNLEITVRQLQDELYRLRARRPTYTCLLTSPLGGSFHGKGDTMLEAKAKSINACERNSKAFCNEDKVVCEKADI